MTTRSRAATTKAKRQSAAAKARKTLRNMRAAAHRPLTRSMVAAKKAMKLMKKKLATIYE
jgi:hypothetical protein